jgi:hypothetical protein
VNSGCELVLEREEFIDSDAFHSAVGFFFMSNPHFHNAAVNNFLIQRIKPLLPKKLKYLLKKMLNRI